MSDPQNRTAQFIYFLKIWKILKKQKLKKSSNKLQKPTDLSFLFKI
jgi:hypothetical protein